MNVAAKTQKKNVGSQSNKKTLDIQHSIKLQQIHEMNERIKHIKQQVLQLKEETSTFQERKAEATEDDINMNLERIDMRLDLEAELKRLQQEYDETQYYVNTADILYKYYDLLEKGRDNNSMANELMGNKNSNSILRFFVQAEGQKQHKDHHEDPEQSRGTLLEKYMMYTDHNFVSAKAKECDECCGFCKSNNMTIMTNDGYAFCNDCFTMEFLIVDHDKPSYKDPPKEISYFAYKRINHFQESRDTVRVSSIHPILCKKNDFVFLHIIIHFI